MPEFTGLSGGVVLLLLLPFVAGNMSSNGSHWVGTTVRDANGLPLFGWSREAGDLRPAHFVASHIMQGLPLLGWLADKTGIGGRWMIYFALLASVVLCAYHFAQALAAAPLVPLSP